MNRFICIVVFSIIFSTSAEAQKYSVIPRQYYSKVYGESFSIKNTQVIGVSVDSVVNLAFVKKCIGSNDTIKNYSRFDILIDTNPLAHEAYRIKIFKNDFVIHAGRAGAFYALQTIKQLDENGSLFPGEIIDYPTYKYRGMHLDVCRHFFTVDEVKLYIDQLARYKFNTFHWHLTEDQGWRIEIKKYPKLTEIGSKRKETLIGKQKDEKGTGDYDKTPVEGFYTQEQIKEVVKYAQERFITVIPEIELPGHSLAAVASYPHLGCMGKPVEVGTRWGVYDEVYCAGKESTFKFLQDVMDEVLALFPSKYIHIGGDEVVKTNWKKCVLCQNRIKEEKLKDEHELQSYFIQRMEKYLNSKGRQIIGWDEILEGGLAPNATVMSWRGEKGGIEAAKAKHNIIMTPGKPCYFDHGYTKSKEEPINIGGKNSLANVYNYNPNPFELSDETHKYVLGSQGNVWTEYIADWKKAEYMVYPRMQALSEVLWLADNMKNYDDFKSRLGVELEQMDKKNMNYRIPEPIGYEDTLVVNNPISIEFRPMSKSHTMTLSLDDLPYVCINDKLNMEPSDKERRLKIVISNGSRSSVPYFMIIPKAKKKKS
jgi:hexosaminidase